MDAVYELQIPRVQRAKRLSPSQRPTNGIVVIDNGSYELRAGYSNDPTPCLRFANQLIRPKTRWSTEFETVVGESHFNVKGYDFGRAAVRSPFDYNVVVNFDTQEAILDYVFDRLGFVAYSRDTMLELLFEGYGFPKALFIPDCLAAFYRNRESGRCTSDVVLLSSGHSATHVVPIINNQAYLQYAQRSKVCGYLATSHLQKLMMLHNSQCTVCLTKQIIDLIKEQCTVCSLNYLSDLETIAKDPNRSGNLGMKIQFPRASSTSAGVMTAEALAEKEMDRAARSEENRLRLKAMSLKRKQKLVNEKEELLEYLKEIQQQVLSANTEETVMELLDAAEVKTVSELQQKIEAMSTTLQGLSQMEEASTEPTTPRTDDDIESVRLRYREVSERVEQRKRGKYGLDKDVGSSRRVSVQHRRRMKLVAEAAAKDDNDDFGADDRDWDVYKEMDTHQAPDDDLDRQDAAELNALKEKLQKMGDIFEEPTIEIGHSQVVRELRENQAYLTVERIRIPELLFQPSLVGVEQAGIAEIVSRVLKSLPSELCQRLNQQLLISGGNACYQELPQRLEREMCSLLPYGHPMQIVSPMDFFLDAWHGAALFAKSPSAAAFAYTLQEYQEYGHEALKRKPVPFVYNG